MFKGNERECLSIKWNFFSSNLFRYVNFFSQLNPNMTKTKKQKLNKLNHQIKLPPKNLLLCQARIQTIATFALADLEKNFVCEKSGKRCKKSGKHWIKSGIFFLYPRLNVFDPNVLEYNSSPP